MITKGKHERLFGVMKLFCILILVLNSQIYIYVKMYRIVYFTQKVLFHVNLNTKMTSTATKIP